MAKTEWKDAEVEEAYYTMMRQQAIYGCDGVLKLEWDASVKKIYMTNYPSDSSVTVGSDGEPMITIASVLDTHNWLEYCDGTEAMIYNNNPKYVIADTDGLIWNVLGRPATRSEIEEHDITDSTNVRVILVEVAYDACDWELYRGDIEVTQETIRKHMM